MAEVTDTKDHQQNGQLQALEQEWLLSKAKAAPATEDQAWSELGRCLTLCAPSGMKDDERETWLMTAYAEIRAIPAEPFLIAAAKARRICDHPAKIIPAIIRESQEFAESLLRVERTKRAQYENASAPRLQRHAEPDREPEEMDPKTAEILAGLKAKATTARAA